MHIVVKWQKCWVFATIFLENSKVYLENTVQKQPIFPVDFLNLPIFWLNYWQFSITFLCRSKCLAEMLGFCNFFVENSKVDHENTVQKQPYFLLTFKIYPYFGWIIGHFQSHFFAGQNARQKCLIFATFFVENSKVDHENTVQKQPIFPVDI